MKIAVLCLCLFTLAVAGPIKKYHDGKGSSEEKPDLKGHHVHKHHHHHRHHDSHFHSQEHSSEHVNSRESHEHHPSFSLGSHSDESKEITEQQTLLVRFDKDDHSKVDSHDDVDDHDDVDSDSHSEVDDDSDDSDQDFTETPTDSPLTPSAAPGPFTGRGDSPMFLKKFRKYFKKFDSHESTEENDSAPDLDSHKSHHSKATSSESRETSVERDDKSSRHDSSEDHSASHHRSVEHDSRQKRGSFEEDHDDDKADTSQESFGIDPSTQQLKGDGEEQQEADLDHDTSIERVRDHHSVEDNETEY